MRRFSPRSKGGSNAVDVEATKRAGARQRFDKPPAAAEPEPPKPAPKPPKKQKARDSARKPSNNGATATVAGQTAKERAEALAAEQYGVSAKRPMVSKRDRAARQAERRRNVARVEAELPAETYAKLLALIDHHGSQRAALVAAIEQARLPEPNN